MIRVVLAGAMGRMGRVMLKALADEPGIELVGAVDVNGGGTPVGDLIGREIALVVETDLTTVLYNTQTDVLVDFTNAKAALENAIIALNAGVCPVIGSTGISEEDMAFLHQLSEEKQCGAVVAPNFALGAVLMMRFASEAAKYFPNCEVIEMHHEGKLDAPSGTAITTAKLIDAARSPALLKTVENFEKTVGVRGGEVFGVPVHSVRLPGLVAHQEVIFGGEGETLTIRHDSLSRESFRAGLLLAVKKVVQLKRMVIGLENLL